MNDLISRQTAIDVIEKHIDILDAIYENYLDGLKLAMSLLKVLPSAQPERKKGRWIWDKDETYYRCSECGHLAYETLYCMDGTYAYCPFCGAKMEGEKE